MFKITPEIARYLIDNTKSIDIPGPLEDELHPFIQRNVDSIGYINSHLVVGSLSKFLVECDTGDPLKPEEIKDSANYYLYEQSEIGTIDDDTIEVERSTIDKYAPESTENMDLTDCAIELPPDLEKLKATSILMLDKLFEVLPEIKHCLDPEKEKNYNNLFSK